MARVIVSEYRAKSLLVSGYEGFCLRLESLANDTNAMKDDISYVVKVDQGVKKRGKQGLIRLNVPKNGVQQAVNELAEKGFTRFIAEPMCPHEDSEERYVSFERTTDGIVISYSDHGGIDIEEHGDTIIRSNNSTDIPLPQQFIEDVKAVMDREHMSFVEINPLLVRDGTCILLDAAVLVDSAGQYYGTWTNDDVVDARTMTDAEKTIDELNNNSPASFSFSLIHPNGSLWLICFGGGASITVADEAMNQGKAAYMGNFGEYSGATVEESYLYTKALVGAMLQSTAPKKGLVIAGGVANFTDVKATFKGTVQVFEEMKSQLQAHRVKVFVRRGGPNEKEGLALMERFLKDNDLFGSVHGSDAVLTDVIHEALEYIDA
jgi:succinyl-CoA synthetase beta subunit